ncbi:polyprenyl synthetase family protein [Humibacter ginsenosidimutans]|uniref:polyprenyl synthetase family protein n=1 Tax=Humibacter ginsenosidimutans TaxID=2599293 RepID=UPI001FEE17F1|nr:polyprenyl synthetase family protein [Humibacter ginsenosidimutans]
MPSLPLARRGTTLTSQLGLGERFFASGKDRRFAARIDEGLDQVEAGLAEQVKFADQLADVTAAYLLNAGGKRVRPMLTLLTAQLGEGATPEVITAAQAVEITHLASLYHDDVMDEALTRRGVPSAQHVWGNSVAVLTGDLLFARASQLVASLGEGAIRLQADTFERLCLGQLHETIGPNESDGPIEHYIGVLADKTGSLIAAAAQMGVMFSGAPQEYNASVMEFGEKIGVGFQLVDDVIDLSASDAETGKTPGTDLRAGVATLPLLKLRELAPNDVDAAALLERIETEVLGAGDEVDVSEIVGQLRDHPVTQQTLDEAHRWAREAVEAIAPLPEGPVKRALTRFANSIVERSS